ATLPGNFPNLNPAIAVIGGVSLVILFGMPMIKNKYVRRIPSPMAVVLVAIPLGMYFDLSHEHAYILPRHFFQSVDAKGDLHEYVTEYKVGKKDLVEIPNVIETEADSATSNTTAAPKTAPVREKKNHRDADKPFYWPDFSGVFSFVGLQYIILFS